MKCRLPHIMAILLTLPGFTPAALAQTVPTGFFIPQQGKIYFAGNSSTIFSDVTNRGQMGVAKEAIVNFKGRRWANDPNSKITDESLKGNGTVGTGGIIRFLIPDSSLPANINQQQTIVGGYNAAISDGASFPNLYIGNKWGVALSSASTKVRRELHFSDGYVYANDNTLVVGDRFPGYITGYNENHFVITGSSASGTGVLLREKIDKSEGQVVFPIGTAEGKYTPAAIKTRSKYRSDMYARVFDTVRSRITDGASLSRESTGKVWQIGQLYKAGEAILDITLQHRLADEGSLFIANREAAFVSQYSSGAWDIGDPKSRPRPGTLTTGAPLTTGGANTRSFRYTVTKASYFTKLAGLDTSANYRTNLWFSAYRTDREHVYVYWTTKPEIRNEYFILQRRYFYEREFHNIDTIFSRAPGGISLNALDYNLTDPNNYSGVTYYRLTMIDYNRVRTYSHIVAVGGEPEGFGWTIWPNPSPGQFFVGISRPSVVKEVIVWDIVGRMWHREPVAGRGLISMTINVKGAYVVGLVPFDGSHIETKKLIIIGD